MQNPGTRVSVSCHLSLPKAGSVWHGSVSPAGLGGTVEAYMVCPDPSGVRIELVAFPVRSLWSGLLMKSVLRAELWIDRHIRRP